MIPWSYSFLNDLANCPHKAMRKYVKRDLPKETSPELEEGIQVHEMFEKIINSGGGFGVDKYDPYTRPLTQQGAKAEVKLGMTKDMLPANFWGPRGAVGSIIDMPWGRGKADVLVLDPPNAFIVDWKTGKAREDDRELRQLALLVRSNYPEVNRITGCYVWLKENKMGTIYDLSDVNRTYHGTVEAMNQAEGYELDGVWPKTPNPLCGWCPVKDCQFNYDARKK